jgi:hypothetical protein
MGKCLALTDRLGDQILAEVMTGTRRDGVLFQQSKQVVSTEYIDPHARQRCIGLLRHGGRIGGLFDEVDDVPIGIDRHHAKTTGFVPRHLDTPHRDTTPAGDVVFQHHRVIHLVDVITGQNHHVIRWCGIANDVEVLPDRIRRTAIPVLLIHPLLRREQVDELVHFVAHETPAALQMAQQGVRLVLGDDADASQARIEAIGQSKIDDSELAAKVHGWLGPVIGEVHQT